MTELSRRFQRGLSLVELMIALVLGLLLTTGVISIFISSKQSYAQQDAQAQIQENVRFALEMIARDLRMAGYGGCAEGVNVANTVENYSGSIMNFKDGLIGYEYDGGIANFPDDFRNSVVANTDAVVIYTVNSSSELGVTSHNPMSATVHLNAAHDLKPGAILLMADSNCSNIGIFVLTGPTNNNNNATTTVHNTGQTFQYDGKNYGNCTKALKGNFDCNDQSGAEHVAYSPGSSVYQMESVAYYIGTSTADASVSSLYRKPIVGNAEEMVEGISDLQLLYGLRSGSGIKYVKANAISASDWSKVNAVRITLTARSLSNIQGSPLTDTFTTTVHLRNRG